MLATLLAGFPGGFPNFGGMPGGRGQSFHFSSGPGGGGFTFSNPEDIFSQFFKSGGANMGDDEDIFASLGGMPGGFGGSRRSGGHAGMGMPRRSQPAEVTVIERPLPISLEDIFGGTTKSLKVTRKTFDLNTGKQGRESKTLNAPIKPGTKAGTKIKFTNAGDQGPDGTTQDIHFVIQEKPHPFFKREGDDLRHEVEVDLKGALTGWSKTISTIDGKQISVGASGPTSPTWTERYPGLGMPRPKKPETRGDLIVGVKIKFPTSLTADQKKKLKEIL